MDQIIGIANAIIKLDASAEKKWKKTRILSELIQNFRRLNGTTSLLQIAMQEEISSVIGTSNVRF